MKQRLSNFMSLLDKFPLTKEVFEEKVIGVGTKKNVVLTIFRKSMEEMNTWCMENYGMDFNTTYEILKQLTYAEWKECLKVLGERGNPSAMSIMQDRLAEDLEEQTNGMVFNVNLTVEKEDAKSCS